MLQRKPFESDLTPAIFSPLSKLSTYVLQGNCTALLPNATEMLSFSSTNPRVASDQRQLNFPPLNAIKWMKPSQT